VKRVVLFAKGNVDVHDSLHSCRIGGLVQWNGINELTRASGALVRLRHETWTRSDAIAEADGTIPPELEERALPLGVYPLTSQFSDALYTTDPDAIILSILGDTATPLYRHKESGYQFYAADSDTWNAGDREWLKRRFSRTDLLDVSTSMSGLTKIIEKIRAHRDVPILIYNVSPIIPGETVYNYQGLDETYSTRCKRFNLALTDLSRETGISIIDVDTIIARSGADRLKVDAMHLTPEGYRLVAEEVVRVLGDLGVLPVVEEESCVPA
jgi:hypothetical protein